LRVGLEVTKYWRRLLNACAAIASAGILFCMAAVTLEVLSRYLYGRPIAWVLEVTEHILLYIPFLGMAWLARNGDGHVRVDLISDALSVRGRAILRRIVALITSITCFAGAIVGGWTTWDHFVRDLPTQGVYPIPFYLLLVIIPFGLGLTAVQYALRAAAKPKTDS
jgi:TRAP-type C4-dicarboxylate transport system permease small subunit